MKFDQYIQFHEAGKINNLSKKGFAVNRLLDNTICFESIEFQKRDFFNDLVNAVEKARAANSNVVKNKVFDTPESQEILQIIKRRCGINLVYDKEFAKYGPAIIPLFFSESHVLALSFDVQDPMYTGEIEKAFKLGKNKTIRGTVDLLKARVTGDFEKIDFRLLLPADFLIDGDLIGITKTSAEEAAAIILHEVGHAFTALEYMTRIMSTNQILANLSNAFPNKQKYEIEIDRASNISGLSSEAKEALLKAKSEKDIVFIVYGDSVEKSVSQLGKSIFDVTACEQLADQFAIRYGAGAHLINALSRIDQLRVKKNKFFLKNILEAVTMASFFLYGLPVGISMIAFYVVLALFASKEHDIYGNFHSRSSRARNELVQYLKIGNLSNEDRKRINYEIEILNNIVDSESVNSFGLIENLAYIIKPGFRNAHKYERLQRELEDMANNQLFVKASKLRELSDNV